jgi:lysophospholipase L1-like esterase
MKRMRSRYLKWPHLLLIGALVFVSFSLRPSITQPETVKPEKEKIGFIGDSITRSLTKGSGAVDAEMESLQHNYTAINQGAGGATSTDWLPGNVLFDNALAVFKTQNVHTVSIMLGTNDARRDKATSPATYRRNIERIVENLLGSGVVTLVIVNYPPYVAPGALGLWDGASVTRLQQYTTQLDIIAQEEGVAQGDTRAFAYFRQHPYQLADGVHPNALGHETLGKLWAQAYKRVVSDQLAKQRMSLPDAVLYGRI